MVFRFGVLKMRIHSPLFGLQNAFIFAWSFLKVSTTCLRTAKTLVRLRFCAGSHEPPLVVYVMSTRFSRAGSFTLSIQTDWPPMEVFVFAKADFLTYPYIPLVFRQTCLSKRCRPRSDATECGVWSGSSVSCIYPIILGQNRNSSGLV